MWPSSSLHIASFLPAFSPLLYLTLLVFNCLLVTGLSLVQPSLSILLVSQPFSVSLFLPQLALSIVTLVENLQCAEVLNCGWPHWYIISVWLWYLLIPLQSLIVKWKQHISQVVRDSCQWYCIVSDILGIISLSLTHYYIDYPVVISAIQC